MSKRSILGSFTQSQLKKVGFDNKIKNIHYTKIKRADRNRELRRIEELAEDIAEAGLENNLLVRRIEHDDYDVELIGGERRFTAILHNIDQGDMTYEYIPCKVMDLDDVESRKRLILNNWENDPLTQSEKLDAVEELKEIYQQKKANGEKVPGRIQQIIASDLGISKSQVALYEKIISHAVPEVREKITSGDISIDAASSLVDLEDEEQLNFLEESSSYTKKDIEEYKDSLKEEDDYDESSYEEDTCEIYDICEEDLVEGQLYFDDNDTIQVNEPMQCSLTSTDNELEKSTIEQSFHIIKAELDKLDVKMKGVEFVEEYGRLKTAIREIDDLMIVLGLA